MPHALYKQLSLDLVIDSDGSVERGGFHHKNRRFVTFKLSATCQVVKCQHLLSLPGQLVVSPGATSSFDYEIGRGNILRLSSNEAIFDPIFLVYKSPGQSSGRPDRKPGVTGIWRHHHRDCIEACLTLRRKLKKGPRGFEILAGGRDDDSESQSAGKLSSDS